MTDLKALKEKLSVFDAVAAEESCRKKAVKRFPMSFHEQEIKEATWIGLDSMGDQFAKDLSTILKLIEVIEVQRDALGLCHKRMKMTAWVEDECFEKAEQALAKTDATLNKL